MYSIPYPLECALGSTAKGVNAVYLYTAGLAPCLVGFACGRCLPVLARCVPLVFIIIAGLWFVLFRAHAFEVYWIGTALYALFVFIGVRRRAIFSSQPFWSLHHFDWMLVSLWVILFTASYALVFPGL